MATMKPVFLLFLLLFTLHSSVLSQDGRLDVTITNGTTGRPGAVDELVLVELDGGMAPVASLPRVSGSATFERFTVKPGTAYLLRGVVNGIFYTESIQFTNAAASASLTVYDITEQQPPLEVSSPHLIFKRDDDVLIVDRTYDIDNLSDPPVTWNARTGTFRLFLPDEREQLMRLSVQTGTMPVNVPPVKTDQPNIVTINTPIKPGRTQLSVRYTVDYSGERYTYQEPLLYDVPALSVIASPPDISVESAVLSSPQMDQTQAFQFLQGNDLKAGTTLAITFSGGSRTAPMGQAAADPHAGGQPRVVGRPQIPFSETWLVILMTGLVLTVGAWLGERRYLQQRSRRRGGDRNDPAALARRRQALLAAMARLDLRHQQNEVPDEEYRTRRRDLKGELIGIMKQLARTQ